MAYYTDPKTGITRDAYGKEVERDPTGTDPHSHSSYWTWGLGAVVAAAVLFAIFGFDRSANAPSTNTSVSQTEAPKSPPPTP